MAAFGKRFLLICGLAKTSGTMFRSIRLTLTATFAVIGLLATASGESGEEQFGPYIALTRNAEIVRDVKIAENGRIYLILNPAHKEKEIILKNSIFFKSGYQNRFNGKQELISPAYQGKAPNEYTD